MNWLKFSQRFGKTPIKNVIQIDNIDTDLKNQLWNIIVDFFLFVHKEIDSYHQYYDIPKEINELIWCGFFKNRKDYSPAKGTFQSYYGDWFFRSQWYEVYDFIEFIVHVCNPETNNHLKGENRLYSRDFINYKDFDFNNKCNKILEQELSGYRIIDNQIVPITSDIEIESINKALENTDKYKSVNQHLKTAIEYLSDKKNPDYRNCIKESISAVEALCKIIIQKDKATLGEALKEIETRYTIHTALKDAFNKIYGYTSDSGGIRHSLTEKDAIVNQEDAIFMLVACSAFINYLKAKLV